MPNKVSAIRTGLASNLVIYLDMRYISSSSLPLNFALLVVPVVNAPLILFNCFFFCFGFLRIIHMSFTKPKETSWQSGKEKICLGLSGKILSEYPNRTQPVKFDGCSF